MVEQPPMVDYLTKLMLLEAIKCRNTENLTGLLWIKRQLSTIAERFRKLEQDKPERKK